MGSACSMCKYINQFPSRHTGCSRCKSCCSTYCELSGNHAPDDPREAAGWSMGAEITYVAGPMTGYHDHNRPAFAGMTARLRAAGFATVNPDELHTMPPGSMPDDWYLRRDLAELVKCKRVVMLPGWANSKGATLEHVVAKRLGMEIVYPESFEEWFTNVHK